MGPGRGSQVWYLHSPEVPQSHKMTPLSLVNQDTVVSMEALAAYAIRDPDQAVANFRVSVSGNDQVGIDVDSSNYEIVQRKEVCFHYLLLYVSLVVTLTYK